MTDHYLALIIASLVFVGGLISVETGIKVALIEIMLVVIGFMGHSKIYDRVWGSTSQNLTRLVPCTVMVVK